MKKYSISIIAGILVTLSACNKEEIVPLSGNIVGFVNLIDENGIEVKDKSGVNVTIKDYPIFAVTDVNGRYELNNVEAGAYKFNISKEGYGNNNKFTQFVGGNVPALLSETKLYEIPSVEIQSLDISTDGLLVKINATITETQNSRVEMFFYDSTTVSNINYGYTRSYLDNFFYSHTELSLNVSLEYSPYVIGDKIYMVLYFVNPFEEYGYYDYELERSMRTSYKKATNVIELILE